MTPVLVDTGFIVALLDRSERNHAQCAEAARQITAPLATCEAVIAEACYLLREVPRAADMVLANVEERVFEISLALTPSCKPIRALMKKYARVPMDFADACLVQLADELDTARILTLDGDFRVYRWRRTRPFELLLDV